MTRWRIVFALLALLSVTQPVGAVGSVDCAATDPENVEQVYACMSSFRRGSGNRNAFANIAVQDCRSIRMNYLVALTTSGLTRDDAKARVPSCALFARVVKDMTGKEPYWSGCLEFGSLPLKDHLARCLDRFIPGYYGGGQSARKMQGCGQILGAYEQGLRAASGEYPLPKDYTRPDCALVADYLGTGQTTLTKPQGPGTGQATGDGETNGPAPAQNGLDPTVVSPAAISITANPRSVHIEVEPTLPSKKCQEDICDLARYASGNENNYFILTLPSGSF